MSNIASIVKNFGKIKDNFNNILAENIIIKDNGKNNVFKTYLKTIKENEILRTQFMVYNNLENTCETDAGKALLFVKENIDLMAKYKIKDILEANTQLANLITWDIVDEANDLYENISKLIFTKRASNNINTIVESTDKVVKYILSNKPRVIIEQIGLPNSVISNLMITKYNEKYESLSESEKKILKVLISSNELEKKEIYSQLVRECIDLINEKLSTADLNAKDKLLQVKDKLLNTVQAIDENFSKNISKLVELKSNLD
jgi:hypothetical protein